jgi:hypothetical protein
LEIVLPKTLPEHRAAPGTHAGLSLEDVEDELDEELEDDQDEGSLPAPRGSVAQRATR